MTSILGNARATAPKNVIPAQEGTQSGLRVLDGDCRRTPIDKTQVLHSHLPTNGAVVWVPASAGMTV
jgi:hypothetical protein